MLVDIRDKKDSLNIHPQDKNNTSIKQFPKDLWILILFFLNPNDFYRMGRLSKWFYALTRDEGLIKSNLDLYVCHFYDVNILLKSITKPTDLKNLIISGKDKILYSYYESKKIIDLDTAFELIEVAISCGNFNIFTFLLENLKNSLSNQKEKGYSLSAILFPAYFGFHYETPHSETGLSYVAELVNRYKEYCQEREVHKDHICKLLVEAGSKWVFEILKLFKIYEAILKKDGGVAYQINTNFLALARQLKDNHCEAELLASPFREYLLQLENNELTMSDTFLKLVEQKRVTTFFEKSLQRYSYLKNESKLVNDGSTLSNIQNDSKNNLEKLQRKVEQLEDKLGSTNLALEIVSSRLDAAIKLIDTLQEELNDFKGQNDILQNR